MGEIVLLSNCWEILEVGYLSTFIHFNRRTNEISQPSYIWNKTLTSDNGIRFNTFKEVEDHLRGLEK